MDLLPEAIEELIRLHDESAAEALRIVRETNDPAVKHFGERASATAAALRHLRDKLSDLEEGRWIVLPCNRDHAEKMLIVAEAFLGRNELPTPSTASE